MNPSYGELLQIIHAQGQVVSPRGEETHEVIGGQVAVRAGEMPDRKGYNVLLGAAEALMLLAGTFDPEVIRAVAPKARMELFTHQAAYGPRTAFQMQTVVDELKRDPLSRRAVVVLPHVSNDGFNVEPLSGTPCTTSIQFLRRQGILNAIVSMRSWDAIFGLPYDLVMFGALAMAVARAVHEGLQVGYVIVTAGSLHVYTSTAGLGERAGEYGEFALALPTDVPDWSTIRRWANQQVAELVATKALPSGFVVQRTTDADA